MGISKTLGASLLTAALLLGPVTAAVAGPAPAATPAASTSLALFDQSNRQTIIETFDGINAFRASKGLKRLKFNVAIGSISQKWSKTMAAESAFHHNSDYVSGAAAGWDSAAENIAWATWRSSGQFFVDMWINSPVHNVNMSRPSDDYLGIGVAASQDGATYATANFFSYRDGLVLPGSYNHPRDYFNGLPAIGTAVKVTATAPTFSRATGKYTIPSRTGVIYAVNGATKAKGTYSGSGKVTVTAKAKAGYKLAGTVSWTYDFTPVKAFPAAPAFNKTTSTYTIPKKTGVVYSVGGKAVAAGTYKSGGRRIAVTAAAAPGYKLSGTSSWTGDFRKAVTPAKPAMSSTTNKYKIPAQAGVTYYVGGKAVKAGTYTAVNGKVLKFTTKASGSTYRLTGTQEWSFRF